MFRRQTIIDIIAEDPSALVRLLRDVYNKGLDDGSEAADKMEQSGTGAMFDIVFRDWDEIDDALNSPIDSVEEFVDLMFHHCN